MFMCLCVTSQKAISDQDLSFELYCEEVNEPPLPICSTCGDFQHIITGGKKIMFMLFIAMPESHNKMLTLIANIGDREHTYICYSH